jgi:tubulin-specific chaperone A
MSRQNDLFRKEQIYLDQQKAEWDKEQTAKRLDYAAAISGQALQIFSQESEGYKLIASADALINTYRGANIALGTYPPPYSYIVAALTVASGLANVARINNVGFAAGGFTGSGYGAPDSSGHKPAGVVHANEYVVPKWQVSHPAYQPIINTLESGRLRGYADGGLVTNTITSTADQQLATMNTIRQLPAPEVSVKEITKVQNRIQVKQKTTTLSR